jgi:hypothetical protein
VEGGVGWWTQIEQELDRAEFLILIMTPSATRSENTRSEWRSARQRGVCVYPVKGAPDHDLAFESLPNWMRKAHFYDPDLEWEKLVAHLRRGCRATRVPFMAPRLSPTFVPRTRETEEVLKLLLERATDRRGGITALRGPAASGKRRSQPPSRTTTASSMRSTTAFSGSPSARLRTCSTSWSSCMPR